HMYN
ncbi:hypothetical protein D041_0606B, partial [Vibrio parahaemolyticus EKP-008]